MPIWETCKPASRLLDTIGSIIGLILVRLSLGNEVLASKRTCDKSLHWLGGGCGRSDIYGRTSGFGERTQTDLIQLFPKGLSGALFVF